MSELVIFLDHINLEMNSANENENEQLLVFYELDNPTTTTTITATNYTMDFVFNKDQTCSICFEEALDGSEWTVLKCKHLFHKNCIDYWFLKKKTCPLCRFQ